LWAGVDAGKSDHYCVVIDADGKRLLSRRAANDEAALLELINAITALADGGESHLGDRPQRGWSGPVDRLVDRR
jgi:hypothetical protein